MDEISQRVYGGGSSVDGSVNAMKPFQLSPKLYDEASQVGGRIPLLQDGVLDRGSLQGLKVQLGEKIIELATFIGREQPYLMLEHQRSKPPDIPGISSMSFGYVEELCNKRSMVRLDL